MEKLTVISNVEFGNDLIIVSYYATENEIQFWGFNSKYIEECVVDKSDIGCWRVKYKNK